MSAHSNQNNICELAGCNNPVVKENYCILHGIVPDKNKEAFEQAVYDKINKKDFNFHAVVFIIPCSFSNISFETAHFSGALFTEKVDFSNAIFSGGADFSSAQFQYAPNFSNAKFCEEANFSNIRVYEKKTVKFYNTAFHGFSDFTGVVINGTCDFFGAKFYGKAKFVEMRIVGSVDFRFVEISENCKLLFQDTPMTILFPATTFPTIPYWGRCYFWSVW